MYNNRNMNRFTNEAHFDGFEERESVTCRTYVLISWMTNRIRRYKMCFEMIWHMFIINVGESRASLTSLSTVFNRKWRFVNALQKTVENECEEKERKKKSTHTTMKRKV